MHRRIARTLLMSAVVALAPVGSTPPVGVVAPRTDLVATIDGMVETQLRDHGIPGAAVSLVGDGHPILETGYGLADVAAARPVSAERTTFHIDSVTKVFTATAVMQLVEQGRLALDVDVNAYLTAFAVADTYPGRPVRVQDLLTHTSGFEDPLVDQEASPTLAEHVDLHQPARVRPPGEVHSYADYNYDLAGYLVEVASGQPYEQYVTDHVLTPLGMASTRFETDTGGQAPSIGIVTTATDMSRFLLAQLGRPVEGRRVLARSTLELMHHQHFGSAQGQPGVTIPLFESFRGSARLLGHSGEGPGSHSLLVLWPDRGLGLFVTYNGDSTRGQPPFDGTHRAREELRNALVDAVAGPPVPPVATGTPSERVTGTYRWVTLDHREPAQLLTLLAVPDLTVGVTATGVVTSGFSAGAGDGERTWTAESDSVYRSSDGEALTFGAEHDGTPSRVATSFNNYAFVLARVPWYDHLRLHLAALAVALVALSTMLAWPVARLVRRSPRSQRSAQAARWLAAGAAVLLLGAAAAGQYAFVLGGSADGSTVVAVHVITVVAAAATAATVGCAAAAWRRRWWTTAGRAHFAVLAVALLATLAFVLRYDLVGIIA